MGKRKKESRSAPQQGPLPDINTDRIHTVNLKGFFRPEDLFAELNRQMLLLQNGSAECLILIHGYGEHIGGTHLTLDRTRAYLQHYATAMYVVPGEDFDIFHEGARALRARHPELEQYMCVCNHGVTIVGKK